MNPSQSALPSRGGNHSSILQSSSPSPSPSPSSSSSSSDLSSHFRTLQQLAAGGFAGAASRTVVAPIDRIKMLMQTQYILFQQQHQPFHTSAPIPPSEIIQISKPPPQFSPLSPPTNPHSRPLSPIATLTKQKPPSLLHRQPLTYLTHAHGHTHTVTLSVPASPSTSLALHINPSSLSSAHIPSSLPYSDKYNGLFQGLRTLVEEEGLKSLWKGNLVNITRVVPYSATQFAAYDFFKVALFKKPAGSDQKLNTTERLLAGALAGTLATTITHPMDVIRLRLSVTPELKGVVDSTISVWQDGGIRSLFKGYSPTILSLAPFIALNFAAYDTLKSIFPGPPNLNTLGMGAAAGLFAQTICYPLDTVRRRMQLKGKVYSSTRMAFVTIWQKEGFKGFYRGIVPNAVKVVPNNAIRFVAYEWIKSQIGIQANKEGGNNI